MKSIRFKIFVYFSSFLLVFVLVFVIMNYFFLEKYVINKNKKNFAKWAEDVKNDVNRPIVEYFRSMHDITLLDGAKFLVLNKTLEPIFDSDLKLLRPKQPPDKTHKPPLHSNEERKPVPEYRKYIIGNEELEKKGVTSGINIGVAGNKELYYIKTLDSGNYLLIYRSVTAITKNVIEANNVLIALSIFMTVFGGIFIFVFSKKITSPIVELADISNTIAKQDFSKKFNVNTSDEIGMLGSSINLISEELEAALESLKDDIRRKDKINEMRKNFISSVSHELKTPIGIIKGSTEALKYGIVKDEERKEEYFNIIIQETDRMDVLIKDLLNISYMESGNFTINESEFDFTEQIHELMKKYSYKFREKGFVPSVNLIDNLIVNADKTRITQVIINYIDNALRHVDDNKEINIAMEEYDKEIKLSVYNSGKNISEKNLENIWLSFYKTDKAHSRKDGNSGLGLAIVKSIITAHNGKYGVVNRENGVEFWFSLPK